MSTTTPTTPDDAPVSKHEFVLGRIRERTTAEPDGKQNVESNVWTSKNRLKSDASKADCIERDEVAGVVADLVGNGDVLDWFGLLAPTDEAHLRAILACENQSPAPRKILIGQLARLLERESA